jgi:hypothetical protein
MAFHVAMRRRKLTDMSNLDLAPRIITAPRLGCSRGRGFMGMALVGLIIAAGAYAADDLSKPIRVSPDGHFLVQPDGKPFFYLGQNAEYLFWRLNREDTDLYLRDCAGKGFTVVLGHVVPRTKMDTPNAYGATAFLRGDIVRPNPAYFEHIDWVVARAAKYGLRIGLAPINGIEYVADGKFNESNAEAYGRWLGQRYRGKGIIWLLGWDATPVSADFSHGYDPSRIVLKDFRPVYDLMAKGLAEGDRGKPFIVFHPPCCSYEGTPEPRTSLYLADRPWLAMNLLQSSHFKDPTAFLKDAHMAFGWDSTFNYEPIRKEYDSLPVRPVMDAESQWEDVPRNLDDNIAAGRWDEADIRNSAYHAVFAGAAGHDYMHLSVFAFYTAGEDVSSDSFRRPTRIPWKEALNAPGSRQVGFVKALVLSRPYFTRIPDQSIIAGDAGNGSAHISGTRDRGGAYLMIYLPEGQPVTIDMNKLSGTAAIGWWYDPRTGKATRIEGTFPTNCPERFTPPSNGRGNDWVLVLDDASKAFAEPG